MGELPNQVIPSITVDETITTVLNMFRITFSDSANSGDQHMLSCKVEACDEDGCQPRKGALTAMHTVLTASGKTTTFDASDFSLTAELADSQKLTTIAKVGDEVGYGGGAASNPNPMTTAGSITKPMVVASVSGDHKVVGTDRTIGLDTAGAAAKHVQIINRLNDRDKRAALQVTLTAGTNDAGKIATNVFTCGTTLCKDFKVNDLIRLHSVMKNGENQPAMDGIHIVTVVGTGGVSLTLSAAIGSTDDSAHLSSTREQIVLTRLNTFPCSVEETRKGTSESLECSGRGLCDGSSGECACFEGYA